MPPRVISSDFSQLFKSSHKKFNSEKFYEAMDMGTEDSHNYYRKCDDIIIYKKEKEKMIPICQKYLRFLDTSYKWSKLFSGFDISLLLNYWLYDKVTHIYGSKNTDEISFGFAALQRLWDTFDSRRRNESYYKKCKPELEMVNHHDWEKRKKLYDYYVDYQELSFQAQYKDDECKYYKQFKETISLYEYFQRECSLEKKNCPIFYQDCILFHPNNILSVLQCHGKEEEEQRTDQTDEKAKTMSTSRHELGPVASEDRPSSPMHSADSDTKLEHGKYEIVKNVSDSVLGAAPVLLTATMLYRYTPLGPWIRGLRGGRTNSMNTMDMFSPYMQETGYRFSEDTANYISYQPI